jgi:hypothetical protein
MYPMNVETVSRGNTKTSTLARGIEGDTVMLTEGGAILVNK